MNILHILNGDATLKSFEDTGLEGDIMVWREMLSEGPLENNITSGSFWKARLEWIAENFDSPRGYRQKVLDELVKLNDNYDEINLWFDFDLHCQANLLGVMTYLKQQTDLSAPAIYLICPTEYPGKEDFTGLAGLNAGELEDLYDNIRVQLSGIDLILAAEAWAVYVSRDPEMLRDYITTTGYWGNLGLLQPALEAQLRRLSLNAQGLNYIEQTLLAIYNSGIRTRPEIYQAFWQTEKIYGMGDLELGIYLKQLKDKGFINSD